MAVQNQFQITLDLPQFIGGQRDNIIDWFSRIEDTIRPIALDAADLNLRLVSILPQKLAGNAYKVYRSLPQDIKNNYQQSKARLSAIFNNQDFIRVFQGSLTARPRQPDENVEVYVSELRSLTAQAFPDFTPEQKEQETLRRFIAGISPFLRGKCRENDVNTLNAAIQVCKNAERAMKEYQSIDMPLTDIYNSSATQAQSLATQAPVLAQIEQVESPNSNEMLEMVLTELRKLSTNTPGAQALVSEMRRQNETTQRLISELRDQKAFDSERNSRSFNRRRDSFHDQRPRYDRSNSFSRQRDGRYNPRSDSYDRRFNYRPRERSQSYDRNRGSDTRRQFISNRESRNNSFHTHSPNNGHQQFDRRDSHERQNYQAQPRRDRNRSLSNDRRQSQGFQARRSPYPSRSPLASRAGSPIQRRVTFNESENPV